jgi:formate dehydrogenase major subunit
MKLSRRSFLKLTGTAAAASVLAGSGFKGAAEAAEAVRVHYGREIPSVCTFCGVGCGIICHVQNGVIINIDGDPDHPINEGTLCSKGSSHYNVSYIYDSKGRPKLNPNRLTHPLYREAGSSEYKVVEWDWALQEIAKRIKETRDSEFQQKATVGDKEVTVNRTQKIGWLGSAFCTNEENYLFHKMARAVGMINVDHCARL